jgi:hypothetical protein
VPADDQAARTLLVEADRHLASAETISGADPNGAYALLYDAARKAVTAQLLMRGLRVTNRPGAHATVVRYAEVAVGKGSQAGHVENLDRIRRERNRSEYGVRIFGRAQVASDLAHAKGIVAAVKAAVEAG